MAPKREISKGDVLLDMDAYREVRAERRREIWALKQDRRVSVGPFCTFYFENFETMRYQVQEMLYAERGGEAQFADEVEAYNPLIPDGRELVATMMLEIEDKARRERELARLTGVERTVTMEVGGETIAAVPETGAERTREGERTSSVHFIRFPFSAAAIEAFKAKGARAVLAVGHDHYGHMAVLPDSIRAALAKDFA